MLGLLGIYATEVNIIQLDTLDNVILEMVSFDCSIQGSVQVSY